MAKTKIIKIRRGVGKCCGAVFDMRTGGIDACREQMQKRVR